MRVPQLGGRRFLRPLRRQPAHRRRGPGRHHHELRARRRHRGAAYPGRHRRRRSLPGDSQRRWARRGDLRAASGSHHDRPASRRGHLPRRRDGVAQPRRRRAPRLYVHARRRGQPQRHLRESPARRARRACLRRRDPGGQVQARVHRAVIYSAELLFDVGDEKLLTIGSAVERLPEEMPDNHVSELRYLEEQGLVTPRRTKSGYRLYSQDDFARLVRVLTMQRDEYLPLKVIRRELERSPASPLPSARQGLRKTLGLAVGEEREYTAEEIQQMTGADSTLLGELEEYELIRAHQVSGVRRYSETDAGIVGAAAQLAPLGLRPKNLRVLQSAVDREVGLIEQVLLPALKSNRPERRREGLEQLDDIIQATTQLRQLLLTRGVRRLAGGRDGR